MKGTLQELSLSWVASSCIKKAGEIFFQELMDQVSLVGVQMEIKFSLIKFDTIFLKTAVLPPNRPDPISVNFD